MNPFGLDSGWAELALRVPPPLVPISLIASWLANGPPGIDWLAPSTVVTSSGPRRVWMAPWLTSTTVKTIASGSRTRTVPRTRSTQKFPIVPARRRTSPRMRATATARPTAADTKFCTASPAIWVR